jgi:hypothetical protein
MTRLALFEIIGWLFREDESSADDSYSLWSSWNDFQQTVFQRLQKLLFVGSLPLGHLENREDT